MGTVFEGWFGAFKVEEIPSTFQAIADDWANTFKGKRQKIIDNLSRVINSEEVYLSKIVDRSNKEYESYINPNREDKDDIMIKRKVKMALGKNDYFTNRESAFQEGGDFEKGIDQAKDKFYENVLRILICTGDKDKAWSAIPKVRYALLGKDDLLSEVLDSKDSVTGTPQRYFKASIVRNILPAVISVCNRGLYVAVMADEAGMTQGEIEAIVAKYNSKLAEFNALIDDALDPNNSKIEIAFNSSLNRWCVHIVEATP